MSFLIVFLFVAGSIGLIIVACNVKDDYPSEQDWEKSYYRTRKATWNV